jgi:hypothetical protein
VAGAVLADAAGLEALAELGGVVDELDDAQAATAARQSSAAAARPETAAADRPVTLTRPVLPPDSG